MKLWLKTLVCGILCLFVSVAMAEVSPVAQLNSVATRMLAKLAAAKRNDGRVTVSEIKSIVNQTLLPEIAVSRMAGSVVGRNYWASATEQQRNQFVREFTNLVVCTYAAALASYNNDRVQFFPLRENYRNQSTIQVNSLIIRNSGQRIPISYNLVRSGQGWKVYDFSIENISIIQNYNAQFAGVLAQSGLVGLITRLRTHNQQTGCT